LPGPLRSRLVKRPLFASLPGRERACPLLHCLQRRSSSRSRLVPGG
jgi:hypothetical protein